MVGCTIEETIFYKAMQDPEIRERALEFLKKFSIDTKAVGEEKSEKVASRAVVFKVPKPQKRKNANQMSIFD